MYIHACVCACLRESNSLIGKKNIKRKSTLNKSHLVNSKLLCRLVCNKKN